jgi:hypothetical protein
MKKIFLILTFTCSLFILKAQVYSGYYCTWYEYGNGTFLKNSYPDGNSLQNYFNTVLPSPTGTGTLGISKVTQVYKPSPPPSTSLKTLAWQYSATPSGFPTTPLPSGKTLYIHTSTSDFIATDTVLFALNYNAKNAGNLGAKKLLFFYNSTPSEDIFTPITSSTIGLETTLPNLASTATLNTINIRPHANEGVSVATASDMSRHGAGYSHGLSFSLNNFTSLSTNIFVTLFTRSFIRSTIPENFQLVLVDQNDNQVGQKSNTSLINNGRLKAHDPNYEIVEPSCLLVGQTAITQAKYKVHFQNTGDGIAEYVHTTTYLPAGYTVADIVDYNTFPWYVGGSSSSSIYNINKGLNSMSSNKLILEFTHTTSGGDVLLGAMEPTVTDPANDIRTMGEFEFTLNLRTPSTGPTNLESYTGIVFNSNDTVKTDKAIIRVRTCCECVDNYKPDDTNNNNEQNNSTCKICRKKNLKKWLRWLLCKDC